VLEAIDALPLHYRLPLVLRYFHELDYEGIAEVLNLSRSQVGTLLFRAKRRLRLELSGGSP
jgi:RNA polymerase sigma-70 factor (ECF subfamily)